MSRVQFLNSKLSDKYWSIFQDFISAVHEKLRVCVPVIDWEDEESWAEFGGRREAKSGTKNLAVGEEHKQHSLFTPRSQNSLQEGSFSERQSDTTQKGGTLLHNGFRKHLSSGSNGIKLSKSGPLKKVRKLSTFVNSFFLCVVLHSIYKMSYRIHLLAKLYLTVGIGDDLLNTDSS